MTTSDAPVEWPGMVTGNTQGREFGAVRDTIRVLSGDKGRFRSATLARDMEEYFETARDTLEAYQEGEQGPLLVLDALHVHASDLVERVEFLKKTYDRDTPVTRACQPMGSGRATKFVFNVTPRDTSRQDLRRTRRDAVTVDALRRFNREPVEIIPLGMTIFSDAPRYRLERDTIRLVDDNTLTWRPGGMVLYNPLSWGTINQWALGAGAGFGIGGEERVLSDFLGAVMLSYRERYRIGVGAGYARVGARLKSQYQVGQKRPDEAEAIGDLLDEDDQPSLFLLFDFTGLDLAKVFD